MSRKVVELRESGVAWLGDVPLDWQVVPAKALFAERKTANHATDVHLTPSQKYGVLPQVEYMAMTGSKVVLNLSGSDSMRHVEPRDFISHLRSFQGGLELSRLVGKVSAAYTVLSPRQEVIADYFKYLFKSTLYVQALQTTTDQLRDGQSIRYSQFSTVPLPLPSQSEQRQIADYLDAQTAKIDTLIGKQEQLIATLAERRQAVISHAVTKGLDPNASMKDSGIEWLSSVPRSWTCGHLRWYAACSSGKATAIHEAQDEANTYPALGGNGFMGYTDRSNASVGSLVVGRVGALCGNVHLVSDESWVTDNALHLVPSRRLNPRYLLHLLRTRNLNEIASKTAQPLITSTQVLDQTVPLPPLLEQLEIASFVDREASKINALSAKARQLIEILKERRQALISAAVTGKIDVRGFS